MFKFSLLAIIIIIMAQITAFAADPTMPLFGGNASISKAQEPAELVLQSIIVGSEQGQSKAIISGKMVTEGQKILNYMVVSIKGKTVTLQSAERSKVLTLFAQPVTQYN